MMAQAMDKELERWEKKHAELQSRYDSLKREKEELSLRWETTQRTRNELFTVLLKGYKSLVGKEEDSDAKENVNIVLDLQALRKKNPNEWTPEEFQAVLEMLLVTCQSCITASNLSIPALRKIIVIEGEKER
jgi:transposase